MRVTNTIQGSVLLLALVLVLLTAPAAALTISYRAIGFGQTLSDTVMQNSDQDPATWDYWSFTGNAGNIVTVTARREVAGMDPILALWDALESDASAYSSLKSDSASTTLLGFSDDDLPPMVPGPFGDSRLTVTLPAAGDYAIAVADVSSSTFDTPSLPELGYNLNLALTAVPLPPSLLLLLSVVALLLLFNHLPNYQ